jgi:hypothetical protein
MFFCELLFSHCCYFLTLQTPLLLFTLTLWCRLQQESGRRAAGHNPDCGGGDAGEQGGGAPPVLRQEARQDKLALVQERPLHRDLQVGTSGEQNMVKKCPVRISVADPDPDP